MTTFPWTRALLFVVAACSLLSFSRFFFTRGEVLDSYLGVEVFYNGEDFTKVSGRNLTDDGYNLGLKYQCVEFVKRFYYEQYQHKMPNSYGHAREFFDQSLPDVAFNYDRGLMQYRNIRYAKPQVNDIIVYDGFGSNPFGHIGIITEVTDKEVEYIYQNVGRKTRQRLKLVEYHGIWTIADYDVLGWLRMQD